MNNEQDCSGNAGLSPRERALRQLKETQKMLEALEAPTIAKLRKVGVDASGVDEILGSRIRLSKEAVDILWQWLEELQEHRLISMVIRILALADHQIDGTILTQMFDKTHSETLKFVIMNTISINKPHSIDTWIASHDGKHWGNVLVDLGYSKKGKKRKWGRVGR